MNFPHDTAKDYFFQLLEVIRYLHSRNICHRDIKPENVMVDKEGNVRVIDFGMSKHITSAKTLMVGTADYLAPELLGMCCKGERELQSWSVILLFGLQRSPVISSVRLTYSTYVHFYTCSGAIAVQAQPLKPTAAHTTAGKQTCGL